MPINFPNSPTLNDLYSYDNKTWEWNGIYWEVYSGLTSYVSGSGTTSYIPKWSNTTTLDDSQIVDTGTQVYIGSAPFGNSLFSVEGPLNVRHFQIMTTNGSLGITDTDLSSWGTGGSEIAIGNGAPLSISTGTGNVAIGYQSMLNNSSGIYNVAIGVRSLTSNQAGQANVAIGYRTGINVDSGNYNVLIGHEAGADVTTEDNRLYIANNTYGTLIYGEFDNQIVNINGTLSATTYDNLPGSSAGNCFNTFYVTNISGCSPVNMLSPLNVQDGLSVTGTSTFTSQANFTGGISASTFSATTYDNLPSFNSVQINGTTQFSGNSNNYINFSGINITITSAATNTLVFSAGTGGGGSGLTEDYYTIVCNQGGFNPVDSTTYYIGQGGYAPSTTVNTRNVSIPFTSTLTNVTIVSGAANAASTQDTTVIFRLNNTTDYTLSNVVKFSGGNAQSNGATLTYNISGLSIPVTSGNFFEIKMICPAWVTNPTSASLTMMLYFKR